MPTKKRRKRRAVKVTGTALPEAWVTSGFCATGWHVDREPTATNGVCEGRYESPFTNRVINCDCKCHKKGKKNANKK